MVLSNSISASFIYTSCENPAVSPHSSKASVLHGSHTGSTQYDDALLRNGFWCLLSLQGMGTGFGTGSAAPHRGDRSIKDISALFSNNHSSLDMGGLSTEEQQALVEAAAQVRLCWCNSHGTATSGAAHCTLHWTTASEQCCFLHYSVL